jgi:hypothetical protein
MELKSFDVLLKALLSELDIKSINKTNPKGITHANSLIASGIAFDTVEAQVRFQYPVQMRISPGVTIYDNSNNAARIHRNRSGDHGNSVSIVNATNLGWPTVSSTSLTAGGGYSCKVKADAEL